MILRVVHWNGQNIGGQDWWIEAWSLQHTYHVFSLDKKLTSHCLPRPRGPFLESLDNFSGPESYFVRAMFTFKTQILLVLKAE